MLGQFKARVNLHGRRDVGDCYVAESEINVLGSDWMEMLGLLNVPMTSIFNRSKTPLTALQRYQPATNRKGQIMTIHASSTKDNNRETSRNNSKGQIIHNKQKTLIQAADWRQQTAARSSLTHQGNHSATRDESIITTTSSSWGHGGR
jgi:hypothetical protein